MRQEYFVQKNIRCNTGTDIIINKYEYGYSYKVTATFLYYDTDSKVYVLKRGNTIEKYSEEKFNNIFHGLCQPVGPKQPKKLTFQKELEIEGLLLGWIWYIFIMGIAIIFKDCIGIWVLTSIIFFNYRNKKLKEAGYK